LDTQASNLYTTDDYKVEGIIQITDSEFKKFAELVYSLFGINLTDKKKALVRGRLNKIIKTHGYKSFAEYYDAITSDTSGKSLLELVDKISTNHSYFFRENDHFDFLLSAALPEIAQRAAAENGRDVKIWCAGCAAGEEAYTLAMVLVDFFGKDYFRGKKLLLATDISLSALKQAVEGVYTEERVRMVPDKYRKRYIKPTPEGMYAVTEDLKEIILFKRLNFMDQAFPFKNKFDLIFCRNVMIYFDNETKMKLVTKFHRYMQDESYLFIGHSESLGRGSGLFQYIQPALYKKI